MSLVRFAGPGFGANQRHRLLVWSDPTHHCSERDDVPINKPSSLSLAKICIVLPLLSPFSCLPFRYGLLLSLWLQKPTRKSRDLFSAAKERLPCALCNQVSPSHIGQLGNMVVSGGSSSSGQLCSIVFLCFPRVSAASASLKMISVLVVFLTNLPVFLRKTPVPVPNQ